MKNDKAFHPLYWTNSSHTFLLPLGHCVYLYLSVFTFTYRTHAHRHNWLELMSLNEREKFLPQFCFCKRPSVVLLCSLLRKLSVRAFSNRAQSDVSIGTPAPELKFPSRLVRGAGDRYRDTQWVSYIRMCELCVCTSTRSLAPLPASTHTHRRIINSFLSRAPRQSGAINKCRHSRGTADVYLGQRRCDKRNARGDAGMKRLRNWISHARFLFAIFCASSLALFGTCVWPAELLNI